jgi:hypothetical protein
MADRDRPIDFPDITGSSHGEEADLAAKGYGSFATAWRTLHGIEAVHMIRKGRVKWVAKGDTAAQVSFVGELSASPPNSKLPSGLRWSLRLRTAIFAMKPAQALPYQQRNVHILLPGMDS